MAKKYKYLYSVHFFFPYGKLGLQIMKGNNIPEARKRFKKKFPGKRRAHINVSRYRGDNSWLISSAK